MNANYNKKSLLSIKHQGIFVKALKSFFSVFNVLLFIFLLTIPSFAMESTIQKANGLLDLSIEAIPKEELLRRDPVSRMVAIEEDLNTICLINNDGTGTMFFFNEPVKYISNDGKIVDKSNKLFKSNVQNYCYYNKYNDINTFFPESIDKHGVKVTDGVASIYTTVLGKEKNAKKCKLVNENSVLYEDVFGKNTSIKYSTLFNGYKEEIILRTKDVPLVYEFIVQYENLVFDDNMGHFSFRNANNGKTVASIKPFIAYDSSQCPIYFEVNSNVEKIGDDSFKLILSLDEKILENDDLVFPLFIDPSYDFTNSYNIIEDAVVYSGKPNNNYGYSLIHDIGYAGSSMGIGRLLVKIPGLLNNTFIRRIDKDCISDVQLHYYNSSYCDYDSVISMHAFTGSTWDEYTVTYNSINWNQYATATISSSYVSAITDGYVSFNITQKVKDWLTNDIHINKGLILINSNETSDEYTKSFVSKDYSGPSEPYISIDFTLSDISGTYYINNMASPNYYITYNYSTNGAELTTYGGTASQRWEISETSDGFYSIKKEGQNKFLGVGSSAEGAQATIFSSIFNVTKWIIVRSSSGGYILYPFYGAEFNRALSLSSSNQLTQNTYSNNNVYNDEWCLLEYYLGIDAYYENAFDVRYSGSATNIINQLNNNAKIILGKLFKLNVVPQGISSFQSLADKCKVARFSSVTTSNLNSICPSNPSAGGTCPSNCIDCTGWQKSFDEFINYHPGTSTITTALFTGNGLYNSYGSICNRSFSQSFGCNGITMQNISCGTDTQYINTQTPVYVHEISHQLCAPDHYHEFYEGTSVCKNKNYCSVCGINPRSSQCIMFNSSTDIMSSDYTSIYCTDCSNDICNHISNHH